MNPCLAVQRSFTEYLSRGERRALATAGLAPASISQPHSGTYRVALSRRTRYLSASPNANGGVEQSEPSEHELSNPAGLDSRRARIQAVTRALLARQTLHEQIGFPGEPLHHQRLNGAGVCSIARDSIAGPREAHIARLATDAVPQRGRAKASETVELLMSFLREADQRTAGES